ncbi:hypothetical protein MFLAVUS_004509 [Mucor flavus]|uniref:Uncharacterized protein n=1 Tax=Mucor flavus TaxID=439312 RepID=A0ABP9YW47_9FUNG
MSQEPRNWNAIAYLMQLVQKDPTISIRRGNKALAQDTQIMQAYVISGTIANTMLRQMDTASKSTKGKSTISEFWKSSASIASTSISYERSKYQLYGQMAEEIVRNGENRSRKRQRVQDGDLMEGNEAEGTQDHGDTEDTPNSGDEKEDEKEVNDIWESWKTLLKTIRESIVLPALSPESHNVIWCGKQVLRRLVLPVDLFRELNDQVPNITKQLVDRALKQRLYDALDTNNKEDWLVKIKTFRNYNSEADLTARRDLMASIFNIFSNLYDGASETLSSSESCLRYYIIDPLLQACNKYLKDHQGITDKRLKYNADGTILFNRISTEILLSEVSSAFAENSKAKTSFDHYKAMFGLLMMLKTIARKYKYANFNTFKGLKVHFIHTHNRAIRHWTMSTPSPGLFLMNKEQKVDIMEKFEEKSEGIMPFMTFSISLGVSLEESLHTLSMLSREHEQVLREASCEGSTNENISPASLLDLVNSVLVRLNENKHKDEVAEDGPQSPSS